MADGTTVDEADARPAPPPPPGPTAGRTPEPLDYGPRPHRGRLTAPDPVLRHEYRGLFATGWFGRFGWLVLGVLLLVLVTLAANVLGYASIWGVANLRNEIPLFERGAELNDLAPGNGYAFAVLALVGIGFAVPAVVVSRVYYGRWWWALTYDAPFRWYNFVKAATAFAVLLMVSVLYGVLTRPDLYSATSILTDPPPAYAIWFGIGLVAILIQSFGEEILFRGLMPRMFGAIIPFRLIAVGLVMTIFISAHAYNPDVVQDMAFNLIFFAVMEVIYYTVLFRTRSISATWAIHWINNAFIFLLISTEPGRTSSMVPFIYTDPVWSAGGSYLHQPQAYIEFAVGLALFCVLLFWKRSPFYLPWHDEPQ